MRELRRASLWGRYYLKIDDDVVWVGDGAIEAMLEEKLRGRFLIVSANVINHSTLSSVRPPGRITN